MPSAGVFGLLNRQWQRRFRSNMLVSTQVLDAGEVVTDEKGRVYVHDGATQEKNLPVHTRRFEVTGIASTLADLRAATDTQLAGFVKTGAYTTAGDGGGGFWRWDGTDTTTTDDSVMTIAPTVGSGRWKRIYEDRVNVRWWGARPALTDHTQIFRNAAIWLSANAQSGSSATGGRLFVPFGNYQFLLDQGTSGLSTVLIDSDNIFIEGEGRGSQLTIRSSYTGKAPYLFTFMKKTRGTGGGVRQLGFNGGTAGNLAWGAHLSSWRNFEFEHVKGTDMVGGLLHAWNYNPDPTADNTEGEDIRVRDCDYSYTGSSNPALIQNGVKFQAGIGSWSDSSVRDSLFIGVWEAGVCLDGAHRVKVDNASCANNTISNNTIDGSTQSGCKAAVKITVSFVGNSTTDTGRHTVDHSHVESHYGTETPATHTHTLIECPATGIDATGATVTQTGSVRENKISNPGITPINTTNVRAGIGQGWLKITNGSGVPSQCEYNSFSSQRGDFRAFNGGQIIIGSNVLGTDLSELSPDDATLSSISDAGILTLYPGRQTTAALGGASPANGLGTSGQVDIGTFVTDTDTGRRWFMDRHNSAVLLGPIPGTDIVSAHGAQQISSMATATAPVPRNKGPVGSTSYSYYVVAVDKDGNKGIPSPVGSFGSGPASLTGSPNIIKWKSVIGAASYDLLKGDTAHSVALGLTECHFSDDGSITTSAYTASAVNPRGTLVVDDHVTIAAGTTPTIAVGAAIGTGGSPSATITGSDQDGLIHIVAGTTGLAAGVMATVTFGKAFAAKPRSIQPTRAGAGAITNIYADQAAWATTGFTIDTSAAPTASASYWIAYRVGA